MYIILCISSYFCFHKKIIMRYLHPKFQKEKFALHVRSKTFHCSRKQKKGGEKCQSFAIHCTGIVSFCKFIFFSLYVQESNLPFFLSTGNLLYKTSFLTFFFPKCKQIANEATVYVKEPFD